MISSSRVPRGTADVFGSVGLSFLWGAVPDGLAGVARLLLSLLIVLAVGGIVGPIVTKALNRR